MPPKTKENILKPTVTRLPISTSSLVRVPDDAVEGYQDRIEEHIDWTPLEAGGRHHKHVYLKGIPPVSFTEALQNKIKNSYLGMFLNEDSELSLEQQWEVTLPITLWENEKFSTEESKICFRSANSLTDNMMPMIWKAVKANNRDVLLDELKKAIVLRVNDCGMTHLDEGLLEYPKLITLNLCGNFLSELKGSCIPGGVRVIELQANTIKCLDSFRDLSPDMLYIGLGRNLLDNGSVSGLIALPTRILVLDLSDNDIYDLQPLLDMLTKMPNLHSLTLAGNPCAVCAAYSRTTLTTLPNLEWLDNRQVFASDRGVDPPHPDDLRTNYFNFYVFRIMSVLPPPKPTEKGTILTFHVEVELPLLDSMRRNFLMYRNNDSLIEMLPPPEDEWTSDYSMKLETVDDDDVAVAEETLGETEETDIYSHLAPKNSRIIRNYTILESNRVPWNKIMTFQTPAIRIFCPDLMALRNTLRTSITVRLVFTQYIPPPKPAKGDKKAEKKVPSSSIKPVPSEQTVTFFTVKCPLRRFDWSQPSQHFHWDESLGTDEALHWGDGDLSILQYSLIQAKTVKGKPEADGIKQVVPEIMTAHFGFSLDAR